MNVLNWIFKKSQQRNRLERQRRLLNQHRQQQTTLLTRAFRQLHLASDFRRLASWGWQCQAVPVGVRQALYRQNRNRILRFLNRRIRAGASQEILEDSLADLLQSLGIASFEAEYLMQQVQRVRPTRPQMNTEVNYQQELERLQREHQQRLTALRSVEDAELREQLLETEQQRFQQHLLNWTEDTSG